MDFSTLETWGYLAVAFFSFGGSFIIVAAAAVFSAMGHMSFPIVLAVATASNFLGDNFLFYLARYHRKEVLPYFAKHRRKLAFANVLMRRYGTWAIFIQKFLYGVKTLVPLVMGLGKYPFGLFVFYNIFASAIFVITIGTVAYAASDVVISFFEHVKQYPWIAPAVVVTLLGLGWFFLEKFSKKTNRYDKKVK